MALKVAFLGKAGSGKTTAAKYLVERYGFTRFSFADPLRAEAARMLACIDAEDERERTKLEAAYLALMQKPGLKKPFRGLMQWLGEYRRSEDLDYWVDRLRVAVTVYSQLPTAIDDLRYQNEAEMLRRLGFFLVRVERPGAGLNGPEGLHESERECQDLAVDVTVDNASSLDSFYRDLDLVIGSLGRQAQRKRVVVKA